jgi:hypothetical protein
VPVVVEFKAVPHLLHVVRGAQSFPPSPSSDGFRRAKGKPHAHIAGQARSAILGPRLSINCMADAATVFAPQPLVSPSAGLGHLRRSPGAAQGKGLLAHCAATSVSAVSALFEVGPLFKVS